MWVLMRKYARPVLVITAVSLPVILGTNDCLEIPTNFENPGSTLAWLCRLVVGG